LNAFAGEETGDDFWVHAFLFQDEKAFVPLIESFLR